MLCIQSFSRSVNLNVDPRNFLLHTARTCVGGLGPAPVWNVYTCVYMPTLNAGVTWVCVCVCVCACGAYAE